MIAVITGADLIADGVGQMPFSQMHKRPDGSPITAPPRYPLTADAARYVGHPFAMVVAETRNQAKDARRARRGRVGGAAGGRRRGRERSRRRPAALAGGVHAGARQHRRVLSAAATRRRPTRRSPRRTKWCRSAIVNNRIVSNPIEPKGAAAQFDAATGTLTLWCPTQNTHVMRQQVAEAILKMPVEKLRVVTAPTSAARFGTRVWPYPEYAAVAYAARKLGRPVKWLADRSETFLSDYHGRDHVSEASLAIDGSTASPRCGSGAYANIGGVHLELRRGRPGDVRARARRPACTGSRCSTMKCG